VKVQRNGQLPLALGSSEGGLELVEEGRAEGVEALAEEDAGDIEEEIRASALSKCRSTFFVRFSPCSLERTSR
jgi:hypothetical protein